MKMPTPHRWMAHAPKLAAALGVVVVASATALAEPPSFPEVPASRIGPEAPAASEESAPEPQAPKPPSADTAAREKELDRLRREQTKANAASAELKREIDAFGEERRKLTQTLIDTAARLRAVEDRIGETENRLKTLDQNQAAIRGSLAGRRTVIAELLAALQRIGQHPPPALMVRPDDALQSLRTAMMLGAVLPEMKIEAEALAADLGELVRVRGEIAVERTALANDQAALTGEQQRMGLLVEERRKRQADTEKALEAERQRAAALARQAETLKDLIVKLGGDPGRLGATPENRPVRDAKPAPLEESRTELAALQDPGRLTPAVAFGSAKRMIPLPVNGVRVRDYGAADDVGGTQKGISMATRAGAQVTAPCDGWIVYAGPFRSYGQLLIINAGGGYHVLLAGMERMSVDLGQFVLTGEPVALMGGTPLAASALATGSTQPILYVEFRKDGTPIDPNPWWVQTESEKVRG